MIDEKWRGTAAATACCWPGSPEYQANYWRKLNNNVGYPIVKKMGRLEGVLPGNITTNSRSEQQK